MTIEITSSDLARRFCKAVAVRGVLAGSALWADARWLSLAGRFIATMPERDAARVLALVKAKPKAFTIRGAVCSRCGAGLSNPESVALGLGPECQVKQ